MIKNLIFNPDIIALKKKASIQNVSKDELSILRHEGWNEHRVQSAAKLYFDVLNQEFISKKLGRIFFFQIDNGANNMTIGAKVRKWQEGTVAKMPDTEILAYNFKTKQNKTWFCEFKRIDTESAIKGNPSTKSGLKTYNHYQGQLKKHEELRQMGYPVHLTNNLVYCEKVIGEEINKFMLQ